MWLPVVMILSLILFAYMGHRMAKSLEKNQNPWLRFLAVAIPSIYAILWIFFSGRNPMIEIVTHSYLGNILLISLLPLIPMSLFVIVYLITRPFVKPQPKFKGLTSKIKPWKVNYRYVGKPGDIDDYGIMATLLDWSRKGYVKFLGNGFTLTNIPNINLEELSSQRIDGSQIEISSKGKVAYLGKNIENNSKNSSIVDGEWETSDSVDNSKGPLQTNKKMDKYEKDLLNYLRELSITGILYQGPEGLDLIDKSKIFKLNKLRSKAEEGFTDWWENERLGKFSWKFLLFTALGVFAHSIYGISNLDLGLMRSVIDVIVALDMSLYLIMIPSAFSLDYTEEDDREIAKWLRFRKIIEDPKTLEQYGPKPNRGDKWEIWLMYSFAVGSPGTVLEFIKNRGIKLPHFEVEDIERTFSKLKLINQKIRNRLNPLERIYYGLRS